MGIIRGQFFKLLSKSRNLYQHKSRNSEFF